ncbi:HNH endonuclease [Actinoplanes sp. L3-i22]|uniref:HNH endonuclease n=1 Tax=Actinoplanes sp. L3-i22 TaxID=2836373 RepID=UPI001C766FF6|nr:hypothetical protein [Actinoplanes sp. L3-i22]BCY10957.1 hypothetical protein L3i22_060450 [Actinoplanes sp. L3-i22]
MIGRLPADEVGYRHGGDNVVLRTALYEVWRNTCHSCRQAKDFADTQIDHVIPHTVDPDTLRYLIEFHGLDAGFHVDRPANLALICGPCNIAKRDRNLQTLSLTITLDRAREHSPEVIRRVHTHTSANDVARGLVTAVRADLRDPRTRRAFRLHAPAVVQNLARIDERLVDFWTYRNIGLRLGDDTLWVSLACDTQGRMRSTWVEDLCQRPWEELILDGMHAVVAEAAALADQLVDQECAETGSVETDATQPTTAVSLEAELEIADVWLQRSRVSCELQGHLVGLYEAVRAVGVPDGPPFETTDLALTVEVGVPFSFTVSWDLRMYPTRTDVSIGEISNVVSRRLAF